MRIILDVMGGDKPTEEFVQGAVDAVKEYGCDITLVGDEELIMKAISDRNLSVDKIEIVNVPEFITMEDAPMSIVRENSGCSMNKGLKLLAEGQGDAFVSAGNTGALLAGATFIVRRIRGLRAAIAATLPMEKPVLLLDSGANIQVTPDNLLMFAKMGSIYMERLLGVKNPKVGLLNNGTERTKGPQLLQDTYKLLEESDLNFIGNIEARDIPSAKVDVIVTDGFTGNVVLKLTEGFGSFMMSQLKGLFLKNAVTKASALIMKKNVYALKNKFDASEYGGAPLLGISKPVIKAHGSSDAKAIKNAIKQAVYYVNTGIIVEIARQSSTLVVTKKAPPEEASEKKQ